MIIVAWEEIEPAFGIDWRSSHVATWARHERGTKAAKLASANEFIQAEHAHDGGSVLVCKDTELWGDIQKRATIEIRAKLGY